MRISYIILAFIILMYVLFQTAVYLWQNDDEIGSKKEYGSLKSAYYQYQEQPIKQGEYIIFDDRKEEWDWEILLGVSAKESNENIWILLTPRFNPLIKVRGDSNGQKPYLSCKNYLEVTSKYPVELSIRQYLAENVDLSTCK